MGIFDRFPYSSTHEMNLDFMLGKATEIAESLQEIDTHKEQAEQAATNAAQSAASAAEQYQAARGAAIRAEVAQGNAENAAADALQHKTDAADAADRAEAASDLADEAVEQAQAAAQTAGTAAQNASTAADGAIASAAAAETRINNLAASLPSDFTALNNEVNNLKSDITLESNNLNITFSAESSGKIINASGTIVSASGFHYTDLLEVFYGYININYTNSAGAITLRVHGYDNNGQWVRQLWNKAVANNETDTVRIPIDVDIKYIRMNCPESNFSVTITNIFDLKNNNTLIEEKIENIDTDVGYQKAQIINGMIVLTPDDFVQGNWSMTPPSGTITTWYKDIRTSKAIDVQPGDRIITKPGNAPLYMRFSVFDSNDTLVQEYKGYYDKLTITDNVIDITAAGKLYINVANGYNAGNSTAIVPSDMTATINVANTYAARETYRILLDKEISVPWECEQHRGYISNTVHSNTLAAYYRAWKNGAQSIETDVRRASDGVYIISHDPTITADGTTYIIAETPSTTLTGIVLSTDPIYGECKVPLFSDVLNLCAYTGMKCNIDCKDVVVSEIAQMVVDAGMAGKCVYSSITTGSISNILSIDPWAGFCITYSEENINTWDSAITSEIVRHNTVFWSTTISTNALRITRAKGFKYMLTQVVNSSNFHYLPDIIEYENTADIRTLNRQYLNTISVL